MLGAPVFPAPRCLDKGSLKHFTFTPFATHHPSYWIIQDKQWPTLEKQMKRKWKQDTWQQQGNHGNSSRLCLLYFGQHAQRAEPSALQFQPLTGESLLHSPSPFPGPAFVQPLQGEFCFSGPWSPPLLPWLPAGYRIQCKSYNSCFKKSRFSSQVLQLASGLPVSLHG